MKRLPTGANSQPHPHPLKTDKMENYIKTSAEVYAVIMAKHRLDMHVHGSFSDPTGNGYEFSTGRPEMMTAWGFKGSEEPLLKLIQTKESAQQKDWDNEYYINCG